MKRLPIRHIGYLSLCNAKHYEERITRIDLGSARYKQLGVKERFKGEAPYRVCKRCLKVIVGMEKNPMRFYRRQRNRADSGGQERG